MKRDVVTAGAMPVLTKARVLVVGDVMLDRYWFGEVNRISPEAPVPIVKVERTEERPGGAANVARNIASLGAQAMLLSVVGDDEAGRQLEALVQAAGVASATLLATTFGLVIGDINLDGKPDIVLANGHIDDDDDKGDVTF